MAIERTAIFVHRPRRIEELTDSGDAGKRKAYQVIRTVELTVIDFENFITDLLVEREFLTGCGQGTVGSVLPCVLVQCRRFPFGVLTAARDGWVEWAAVLDDPGERGERGKSCPRDPA